MAFKTNSAPYLRTKKSTFQIMIELGIALALVWIAAVVTTFLKLGSGYGIKSILLMVVALVVTFGCDAINTVLTNKKDKTLLKKIGYDLIHNYSWITAMIFTLCCPVWSDYYVIIVGSIFSTVIGKLVFGGFGRNIFNPAAIGRIFVGVCFEGLPVPESLANAEGLVSGSTVTGAYNSTQQWLGTFQIGDFSLTDLLLGNYFGTMGETFTVLLVVIGIVLALRGVINWRAPVFYIGTTALAALAISIICGFNDPLTYTLYHLSLGGLMFGAVFMITDPVTTPTSPVGNCVVGVIAALLTVLTRIYTNGCEGVVYSLAIVNLISPTIDNLVTAKTGEKQLLKSGVTFGTAAATVALCAALGFSANGGKEVYSINGIDMDVYNKIYAAINLDVVEENGYQYAVYSKGDMPTHSAAYENIEINVDTGKEVWISDKAYSIVDANGNEVGVVYCIKTEKDIPINTGYAQPLKSCTAYVAFKLDGTLLDVSLYTPAYQNEDYKSMVNSQVNKFEWEGLTNQEVQEMTGGSGTNWAGATYSLAGTKKAIDLAFAVFTSEFNL